jgi:two-component system response regulator ResD
MTQILVIEDEPSVQAVLLRILSAQGYGVIPVSDGRAALRALDQVSPDLIILDIYLPILDGRRFVHEYRQRPGSHAPILIITGGGYAAERATALDAAGSLDKPFSPQQLLAKVEALIRAPAPAN